MATNKMAHYIGGSFTFVFGFIFFAFGSLMVGVSVSPQIVNDYKLNRNHLETKGLVVEITNTDTSVNEEYVKEFVYEYETPDKERITSFSYSSTHPGIIVSDTVSVEYHPENYYMSRIQGMETTKMGLFGLFLFIFPVVGLVIAYFGISRILKAKRGKY